MRARRLAAASTTFLALGAAACSLVKSFDGFDDGYGRDGGVLVDGGDAPKDGTATPTEGGTAGDVASPAVDGGDGGSSYRNEILADDPIAYFPFEEDAGAGSVASLRGDASAFVLANVTLGAPGVVGKAASFPGTTSDWITAEDRFDFPDGAPFSIECWARPSLADLKYNNAVVKTAATDGYAIYLIRNGSSVGVVFHVGGPDGGTPTSNGISIDGGPLAPDAGYDPGWLHLVGTFDGTTARLFMNGQPFGSVPVGALPTNHTDAFRIGFAYLGLLDEVAVYDKALTLARIVEHYRAGKP